MNRVLMMAAVLLLAPWPALSQDDSDRRDGSGGRRDRDLEDILSEIGAGVARASRRAAAFLLRSGDSTVAVRCDPQDSMRTCVDVTIMLLDRSRSSLPPGPGAAPGTPPPSR